MPPVSIYSLPQKGAPMHLEQLMEFLISLYKKRSAEILQMLQRYPEGRLQCHKNGRSSYKYLIRHENKSVEYLYKTDQSRRLTMIHKSVLTAELEDCRAQQRSCEAYLQKSLEHPHALESLLKNEGIRGVLLQESKESSSEHIMPKALSQALFLSDTDTEINAWVNASYPKNPNHPESLRIPTSTGEYVRSKIEAMVVELLVHMKIPFRYEQEYLFDGKKYYPDFTLLNPKTGEIYILELFGMMDDPKYAAQAGAKIALYAKHGFVLNRNLLCFCETEDHPFDIGFLMNSLQYLIHTEAV